MLNDLTNKVKLGTLHFSIKILNSKVKNKSKSMLILSKLYLQLNFLKMLLFINVKISATVTILFFLYFFVIDKFMDILLRFGLGLGNEFLYSKNGLSHLYKN